ncbi:peptide/nickel transport system permease protein [Actinomadura madurae]|uniref:Peptide/nickel transport system permease protein n=1 Tax=Actinomadura madurae TaxID=1993 RepID=A0A1I4WK30_9ACTN|nr:ABC transporter permease [Actinomadura madurae]SFN13339.1 peptide/nickel transport system permease protein [Actinomadura madurae]
MSVGGLALGFKGSRRVVAGLALLVLLGATAFTGPLWSPWGWDETDLTAFGQGPSARHWLGTTQSGRDVLALTLRGAQRSLLIGLCAALLATGLAAVTGAVAGFAGGRLDRALMWGTDLLLVLPPFLVLVVLAPRLGGGWPVLVPLLAAFMWMVTARMVRATTVSLREREYVVAARLLGAGAPRVIVRHVLPPMASLLAVDASLNVSVAITAESGLSYLGFGVRPPDVSLGTVLADGHAASAFGWAPGAAAGLLVLTVLAVNLLGDGLRDVLDPEDAG